MADSAAENTREKAYRVLKAIKVRTENSHQPIFIAELAPELNLDEGEVQGAFRYLKGKRWVDTFNIDYTARINAAGHDVIADVERWGAAGASHTAMDQGSIAAPEIKRASAMEWDVFISHASEDKDGFVRPLAKRLQEQGLRVWFDEFTLTVGDSLRRSIDLGLANSQHGMVVISPDFLKKEWPQKELDGLVAREVEGVKVILPVWHNIGAADIRAYSPTLADRVAVSSSRGLDHVTDQLLQAIRQRPSAGDRPSLRVAPTAVPASSSLIEDASTPRRQLKDYASDLHRRRVELLLAGKGPVAILDGGALVMHVVPYSAIGDKPSGGFEEISRNPHRFPPMSSSYGCDCRITYDGLLVGSNDQGLSKPQRAYVSVFRAGVVEAVGTSLARGHEHSFLVLPQIQATIIKSACTYARTLGDFSAAPPLAVCVSLINVEGMNLLQDFIPQGALLEDLPCGDLDRNRFDFGQAIFETHPANYNEAAKALRPILSHLANAAGLHSSPYFDAAGNYTLVDKL
jgi:hypothetical protein